MPFREVIGRDRKHQINLVLREWIGLGRRLIAAAEIPAQPERRVGRQQLVLDCSRQHHAQGSDNPAHGGEGKALGATRRHEIPAVGAPNRRYGLHAQRRQNVLREMALIESNSGGFEGLRRRLQPTLGVGVERGGRLAPLNHAQITLGEALANLPSHGESRLAITDLLLPAVAAMVDEDPPTVPVELDLDAHVSAR